ncbi:MAG: hypothetical protein N3A69_11675 [Leptospiraceae bacterium]|nr:hypothetical protein [Leptospiraceae bacterium]
MKIKTDSIEFNELKNFTRFVYDNDLVGVLQLSEPLKDKAGNILIKEQVNIKESALKKLETMEGQYEPSFKLRITDELLNKLKEKIVTQILPRIEQSRVPITRYLYENNASSISNYRNFLITSLYKPWLVLYLYDLSYYKSDFFYYIVDLALLALAVVIQKSYQFRYVNRYTFLTGLMADILLSETENWRLPYASDAELAFVGNLSSSVAQRLFMPEEIYTSLQKQLIPGIYAENSKPLDIELVKKSPLMTLNLEKGDSGTEEENEFKADCIHVVAESLKIARFIMECYKKIDDKEKISEKLVVMLTYNTVKGTFDSTIAEPVIRCFKDHEKVVRKIRKIAELENQCLKKPSAWAYPKPNSTQILCKDRIFDCPYFLSGWDINIVSSQAAFGYVGTALTPGSYPKCKLEKDLQQTLKEIGD